MVAGTPHVLTAPIVHALPSARVLQIAAAAGAALTCNGVCIDLGFPRSMVHRQWLRREADCNVASSHVIFRGARACMLVTASRHILLTVRALPSAGPLPF